jgi:hypothetical protein
MVLLILLWGALMLRWAYRSVEAWHVRSVILKSLDAPDHEYVVTVDGRPTPNRGAVLGAIRGMHLRAAHHTHPGHEIPVVILRKRDALELTLARDSAIANEYWVFWTREMGDPKRLEIGRIETSTFDSQ